jgi:prepilin-type N-terminal cleavage/methylation domain-containing protein
MMSVCQKRGGFSLVELLVAISIAGIVLISMTQAVVVAVDTTERERHITEALHFAEEGIEAVRAMRNSSWSANIQPLTTGLTYYVVTSGDNWSLTNTNPGLLFGQYDRTIQFAEVFRDANDTISASGTSDPDSRKMTVTVGWRERNATTTVVLETYLMNFLRN